MPCAWAPRFAGTPFRWRLGCHRWQCTRRGPVAGSLSAASPSATDRRFNRPPTSWSGACSMRRSPCASEASPSRPRSRSIHGCSSSSSRSRTCLRAAATFAGACSAELPQPRAVSPRSDDAAGADLADPQRNSPGGVTVSVRQHSSATPGPRNGADDSALVEQLDAMAEAYGSRFLLEPAPDNALPKHGMRSVDAMRLIGEDLVLDGIPMRNLATFVTTWMEPEAQRIIAENLHRNFIDHAEYPQTAEIEQRCIRMLADLFHAPGETTGARTQGSSEAIMLGALSLKWKWRARREKAGKGADRPNLVFGGDVHVVWEKFCRYFDVEPRIIPLQPDKYTIGPEDVQPHVDENTIGVAAVLGTTFTGHADDIVGINF